MRNRVTAPIEFKNYAALFLLAVALRMVLLGLAVWSEPSFDVFLSESDAGSFLRVAKRVYGGSSFSADASGYHERVFLGWPLLFGWTYWLGCPAVGMVVLDLTLAGLVPCLFLRLSGDRAVASVLCFFTPAWLVHSTYPMSEAAFLASGLGSLILLERRRFGAAGTLLGLMGAVRPHAAALLIGQGVLLWRRRHEVGTGGWIWYGVGLTLAPMVFLLVNWRIYRDVFHQLHVYSKPLGELNLSAGQAAQFGGGGHWGAPFYWLVATPLQAPVSIAKLVYIYAHAGLLIGLAWFALRDWRRANPTGLDVGMFVWFLANAMMIVSAGPYWGFHSFDRYFVWAWPAGLWIMRSRLRPGWRALVGLCLFSALTALYILLRKAG